MNDQNNAAPASNPAPQSAPINAAHKNTIMAVLSYLGILIVIPFIVAKEDPFVKFHIKQGALLLIIEAALWLLGMVSWQLWALIRIVHLGVVVLAIIGIINAIQNKEKALPLIGHFSEKIKI